MATRKVKPNIAGMIQNVSENVQPRPHHPTPEEIHQELTENLSPTPPQQPQTQQPLQQQPQQYSQQTATYGQPTAQYNQQATQYSQQAPFAQQMPQYAEPRKLGRPFSGRTVQTRGGKQVAFDKEDDEALYMASYRTGHSQKDIIRTAVHQFLKEHYNGTTLDEEGAMMIDEYVKKTTLTQF